MFLYKLRFFCSPHVFLDSVFFSLLRACTRTCVSTGGGGCDLTVLMAYVRASVYCTIMSWKRENRLDVKAEIWA